MPGAAGRPTTVCLFPRSRVSLSMFSAYSYIILNGGCVVLFSRFYVSDMATREVPAEAPADVADVDIEAVAADAE